MQCFVALGGNFEGTLDAMVGALHLMGGIEGIGGLKASRLYRTVAVECGGGRDFLNAAASFNCKLSILELFECLESIEKKLGKVPKKKNEARLIDIDLLYYGDSVFKNDFLQVPHPRLHERLFVLAPLSDLMDTISLMQNFKNVNSEHVVQLSVRLPYDES